MLDEDVKELDLIEDVRDTEIQCLNYHIPISILIFVRTVENISSMYEPSSGVCRMSPLAFPSCAGVLWRLAAELDGSLPGHHQLHLKIAFEQSYRVR